jgi:hypothetical protein
LKISDTPPHIGDPIAIVGFGVSDPKASFFDGSGKRRYGMNQIADLNSRMIHYQGMEDADLGWFGAPTGLDASSGAGDSGGAVLNSKGELIGIIEGAGNSGVPKGRLHNMAVDLSTEFSRNFLLSAMNENR